MKPMPKAMPKKMPPKEMPPKPMKSGMKNEPKMSGSMMKDGHMKCSMEKVI